MTRSPHRRSLGSFAAALVLTLLGVGAGSVSLVQSAVAAEGACPEGTGVTVVVDFGPLGGGVQVGCDPDGAGEKASTVVPKAGFSLTYVNGQAFVCRIDGLPDASQESCQRTPPSDSYWGLFWSDGESGTWTYSTQGVTALEVEEGGWIGWRFQDGGDRENPGMSPGDGPSEPAASPTPKPSSAPAPATPRPSSTPAGSPSSAPTSASTSGPGRAEASSEATPRQDGKPGEPKERGRGEESPSSSPSATDATDATLAVAPTSPGGDGSGPSGGLSLSTLLAAGSVAGLGAAAVVLGRRRRS